MSAASWFCASCNALLPTPDTDAIKCELCGTSTSWGNADPALLTRRTLSAPRQEPDWLVAYRKKQKDRSGKAKGGGEEDGEEALATVDEPCPKCGNPLARFYTQQLRSVDEGQTVFYECVKCKHQWNQDN